MANPEILKEVVLFPEVPTEPFVRVRVNDKAAPLTLTQALQKIQELEKTDLSQKTNGVRKGYPWEGVAPFSRRTQKDLKFLEEARKNPPATSYPLVSCILRSHPDNPFQISAEILSLSERFPKEGEENPFYRFICDRPVDEALEILNQPEAKKVLWQIFSQRLKLYQKVLKKELSASEALTQFIEKTREITFPESLVSVVREIGEKFPLTPNRNNSRRF